MEGKVNGAATRAKRDATPLWWLINLVEYLKDAQDNPSGVFYAHHKTPDEKRELINKRARKSRALKKAQTKKVVKRVKKASNKK